MAQVVDSPQSRLKLFVVRGVKRSNGGYQRDKFIAVVKAKNPDDARKAACRKFGCKPPVAVIDMSAWLRALSHEALGYTIWIYEVNRVIQKHITGSQVEVFKHFRNLFS